MSSDDLAKIEQAASLVDGLLGEARLDYRTAVEIQTNLKAIETLAARFRQTCIEANANYMDIIEGLLTNWPHTEIANYSIRSSGAKPVFSKFEALRRAAALFKE